MTVHLYPHQQDAVEKLSNGKILWGGVGTGKSLTAAAYYIQKEAPRDVYVITTAKKRDSLDWQGEFAKYGVGKSSDATVAGILTIDSWNNIGRYVHIQNAFFIFDEQRLVGSGNWVKSFIKIAQHNRWILLSATPGDTWLDYVPVFIANGFYRNRTDFKNEHVVYRPYTKFPQVDHYVGVGRLLRLRNDILVEMPYMRLTTRHLEEIPVEYPKATYDSTEKKRWNYFEDRPLKNVSEMFSVLRKVVNSSESRVNEVRLLLARHPKLIVFYNFDYELEALRGLGSVGTGMMSSLSHQAKNALLKSDQDSTKSLGATEKSTTPPSTTSTPEGKANEQWQIQIPVDTESFQSELSTQTNNSKAGSTVSVVKSSIRAPKERLTNSTQPMERGSTFQIAEWNGHKHQPIPDSDSWLYLVQYTAGSEGWNCTDTDAMVFYSLPYSYKVWHQAHGRIDRLNTPYTDLYYYTLISNAWIDKAICKALTNKENFHESATEVWQTGTNWDKGIINGEEVGQNGQA